MKVAGSLSAFPGGDLVGSGWADLENGIVSEEALLVSIAALRLRDLGLAVPILPIEGQSFEHRLYEALENRCGKGAHAAYNSLIERVVSFANTYRRPS